MALAPKPILEIQLANPAPPADNWWSTGGGNAFPLDRDLEWDQVLAPGEEYDESLVSISRREVEEFAALMGKRSASVVALTRLACE